MVTDLKVHFVWATCGRLVGDCGCDRAGNGEIGMDDRDRALVVELGLRARDRIRESRESGAACEAVAESAIGASRPPSGLSRQC